MAGRSPASSLDGPSHSSGSPNERTPALLHDQDEASSASAVPPRLRLGSRDYFDYDDFQPPLPSPPYKTVASSSHLVLEDYPTQTPPYRSRANLPLMDGDENKGGDHGRIDDTKVAPKPSVHYPDDVHVAIGARDLPQRLDSDSPSRTAVHSRASSIAGTDDEEDESEDYDWSAEEDLVDEQAKYQQKMGITQRRTGLGFRRIISLLFGSLIGSLLLAGLLVTGPLISRFFWYKPHPTASRRYKQDNIEAWVFWAAANVIVSWWLAMLIDIVPAVIRGVVALAWGHVSEAIKTRLELYNSVKGTIKPLFYASSGWVSWVIIFENIYKLHDAGNPGASRASYTKRVSNVIEFFFFLALVWCAQKMLSHAIAFAFHRTAFKERIEALKEALRVIDHLRVYHPKPRQRSHGTRTPVLSVLGLGTPAMEKGGFTWKGSRPGTPTGILSTTGTTDEEWDGDAEDAGKAKWRARGKGKNAKKARRVSVVPVTESGTSTPSHKQSPSRTDSPTPHSLPHRYPPPPASGAHGSVTGDNDEPVVVHAAKVLKNAVLHDARNIEGKETETSGLVWDVTSAHEAKRLARLIYTTFRDRHRRYLLPSDFTPAYPTPEAAQKAFRVFDTDNNGDISRAEIKTTLLKVYKERRFLSRSMRDVGAALHTLDRILLFFAAVILFFISLSVFNVSVGSSLTSVYSIGIAASFIFKNSASNAFDAIMFLFVTHPFDTGDRCFIDDENFVVKKMGLFATVFARADGTETYYFNSQLFNKFMYAHFLPKTFENLTMQVAWRTPFSKLDALEKALNDWLAHDENRWFMPSTSITLQNIQFQRHLELTIGIGHNGNWQDWGLRMARKTAFHAAVQYYCRQLGIVAVASPMPIVWADENGATGMPLSPSVDAIPASPSPSAQPQEYGLDRDEGQSAAPAPVEGASNSFQGKRNWLGFVPPANAPSEMRARKSMSRKAAMRGLGADG
ncbi:hypothetical protein BV25DRAFT_1818080 [Artomyces pyxidatus]|uniref:Uncharacterized protein n=1 Tax=Artomyces pyxidatus TaxID=48021 RepID=A0ACB8TL66_9AGAM|nr:hypothetical protein BV25DRAFT_1818080 [Artomyces pyxidatus]